MEPSVVEQCEPVLPQAGLANALPESATLADLSDYDSMVDFLANAAPEHTPGEHTHYHYLTFGWLIGGLIQAVSGSSLVQVSYQMICMVTANILCPP